MVRISTSTETSSDHRPGERVARNPTTKPTPNKISRIFVTINYKDPQLTPLENETKMHAEFEQMKTILEENLLFMSLASGWEEYGAERNAHIHLLLQADAKNRLRLTQWKTAIREQLKITVNPHLDMVT